MNNKIFSKKSFFGAALGTMFEYYDYALFLIFLPILAPLFFPADTAYQSLVKGYFILFMPMLARPLGGMVFGYIGDTLGRRKALLGSLYGIAFATFFMGIAPSYAMIGASATVIVVIVKTIQLFCFGGEYNGAGIYVVEHAQDKKEGLVGSLLTAATLFGSLFASLVGIVLTAEFMPSWSWRIAFILGGIIGIIGIFYRKNLLESPQFTKADSRSQGLIKLLTTFPREIVAAIFVGGFSTVPFTTVLVFINPVLMTKGYFTHQQLMIYQTFYIFVAIIALIIGGFVADKKSPRKVMQFGALALILCSYPLLLCVDSGKLLWMIPALATLIIINEILLGPSNAYLKNLFSMQYRYRGTSLGFCLGMSLFGGLTPIVENYFYQMTGQFSSCSLWLILIGVGTYVSLHFVKKPAVASEKSGELATAVVNS